ncbi:MAG: hypothetical protein MJ246_03390 [Clostridia bacterium]|nr:hypothetical protein [Clostridia bacterium]
MNNEDMTPAELIAKYESEISECEAKLADDTLTSMDKEMIRSKIRSLNLNITTIKMNNNM